MTAAFPAAAHRALILMAGRGKRLGPASGDRPKALLDLGGRTLLARHLDRLRAAGVESATVVTGYGSDKIDAALSQLGRDDVARLHNPDWNTGSIVSLVAGAAVLRSGDPVLLMDADVLYDGRLLDRLLGSPHPDCLLMDRDIEPGDEPVKVCLRDRPEGPVIVDFDKRPELPHDRHGESVGFFRLSPETAAALADRAEALIAPGSGDGGGHALEYERPLRDMIRADGGLFAFEDVTGLPWTEIDFVEDVEKATRLLAELHA